MDAVIVAANRPAPVGGTFRVMSKLRLSTLRMIPDRGR
jgi:hypothetical protein